MSYRIVILPIARQDILDARYWDNDKGVNLPKRFTQQLKIVVERLRVRPQVHSVRYKNIRIANIAVFPNAVHFIIEENTVVILAVFHVVLNPEKCLGRNK
ncbi:MAG TPA: hypothetical protein VGB84_00440 [Arachidicoccus sp.]